MAGLVAAVRAVAGVDRRAARASWPVGTKPRPVPAESLAEAGHGHGVHPLPCLICRELEAAASAHMVPVTFLPRVVRSSGEAA